MTDRTEMIELARRRAGIKAKTKAAEKARKAVDTSIVYITLKEVAQRMGEGLEAARWAMRGQTPVKVQAVTSKGATGLSVACGYTAKQVEAAFSAIGRTGLTTKQVADNFTAAGRNLHTQQ